MKSLNESLPYSPVSPKLTCLVTEVGYNRCVISGSQQCILGQGGLVMALVQLTLCKIIASFLNSKFKKKNFSLNRGNKG